MPIVTRTLLLALIAGGLSACHRSGGDFRSGCAGDEASVWKPISPPADASRLKAMAAASPVFPNAKPGADRGLIQESWFQAANGDRLFCKTSGPAPIACAGRWWRFRGSAGKPMIVAKDGWICAD